MAAACAAAAPEGTSRRPVGLGLREGGWCGSGRAGALVGAVPLVRLPPPWLFLDLALLPPSSCQHPEELMWRDDSCILTDCVAA